MIFQLLRSGQTVKKMGLTLITMTIMMMMTMMILMFKILLIVMNVLQLKKKGREVKEEVKKLLREKMLVTFISIHS